MKRSIQQIIPAQRVNMGGHLIDQPLPTREFPIFDPFLLIHHWKQTMPGGQKESEVGVAPHPHRGFSPITFIYKGEVSHRDSFGNSAIVKAGGTQWMFAGSGVIHSERPSKKYAEEGGDLEFIQFWVNAPAKSKMKEPYYYPLSEKETPVFENEGVKVGVVCGEFNGVKGGLDYYSPLELYRVNMNSESNCDFSLPDTNNTMVYVVWGEITINGTVAKTKDLVVFQNDGSDFTIKANKNSELIVFSGEPLNEPIATYGPMVMNTQQEIIQALNDVQAGKMGHLNEVFE